MSVRLFIGVRVALDSIRLLTDAQKQMAAAARTAGPAIKWLAPESFHVTLKFLGWARPEVIDPVRDAGTRALRGAQSLRFVTKGTGAFPAPAKARVVWAGVDDGGKLGALAKALERPMIDLGFPAETRAYHPHVTLGRLKEPADVSAVLAPHAAQIFSETWVESVVLYESVTKSSGSEYSIRAEWPLEGPKKPRKRQTEPVENLADHDSEDLDGSAAE